MTTSDLATPQQILEAYERLACELPAGWTNIFINQSLIKYKHRSELSIGFGISVFHPVFTDKEGNACHCFQSYRTLDDAILAVLTGTREAVEHAAELAEAAYSEEQREECERNPPAEVGYTEAF